MTHIPLDTKYLLITLESKKDRRFAGINRLCRLLDKQPGFHHHRWENKPLSLRGRPALKWALVNGHGPRDAARISSGKLALNAGRLILPRRAHLYLLGCYQGKEAIIKTWAKKTRVPLRRVRGG